MQRRKPGLAEPQNPPTELVTEIIDSYSRETLWRSWGLDKWADEEIATRERAMQELSNRGYTSLIPLIKTVSHAQKKKGKPPTESPARGSRIRDKESKQTRADDKAEAGGGAAS